VSAKSNPSIALKEILEVEEYLAILNTPCFNQEIKSAFLFSCYTGLRWVDVKRLHWSDIKENILTTRIIQEKTGQPVTLSLHPIALTILETQSAKSKGAARNYLKVFRLPSADGANKELAQWIKNAGIDKHITWSCARLSFSVLLQDKRVNQSQIVICLVRKNCLISYDCQDSLQKFYRIRVNLAATG
jgi:integrase